MSGFKHFIAAAAKMTNSMALDQATLTAMRQTFVKSPKNILAQNVCTQQDPLLMCMQRSTIQATQHVFSHKVKTEGKPMTDQKSSGRCWIFACLNAMRIPIMEKLNVEDMELSQPYLFFWDKVERCNYFLSAFVETARRKEPVDGRLMSFLLSNPTNDGGQWAMLVNLVEKHGVMPKHAMPESASTEASRRMNLILNNKMREFCMKLRQFVEEGKTDEEILKEKEVMMQEVYRIVGICLGIPPETFVWEFYDKDKAYHRIPSSSGAGESSSSSGITPLDFYREHVKPLFNMEDKLCLVNDPRPSNAYYKLYTVDFLGNLVEGGLTLYINLPVEKLKEFAAKSIKEGEAVWFGCDVGKHFAGKPGIQDLTLHDYSLVFDTSILGMSKAERLIYGESLMTHAMVLTAVGTADATPDAPVAKWRVENSWGEERGSKGYLVMTDDWFSEFTYEVVVDKKFVDADVVAVLQQTPVALPAWDPMGALAR